MSKITDFYSKGAVLSEQSHPICRAVIANEFEWQSRTILTFDQKITLLLEDETTTRMYLGEELLDEGPTHGDFYGFLTSPDERLLAVKARPKDGTVHWTVTTDLTVRGCVPAKDLIGRGKYQSLPGDWIILNGPDGFDHSINTLARVAEWIACTGDDRMEERFALAPHFGYMLLRESHVIYDTRNDAATNRALFIALIDRCIALGAPKSTIDKVAQYDSEMA